MKKIGVFLFSAAVLIADEPGIQEIGLPPSITPWFTGPLVARSAYTTKPPHWSIQPFLYYYVFNGSYDQNWKAHSTLNFYSTTFQLQAKRGLLPWMDFQFYPSVVVQETEGKRYGNIGDMPLGFGFQLLDSKLEDPWPAMRLVLRVNVPFGKYQHLHSHLLGTDAIGAGSWLPAVSLHLSKMWRISGYRYFEMRLVMSNQFGAPVHVKGLNSYGGASNTNGTVYPGNQFMADWAMQISITRRWAFACDVIWQHANKRRFSGKSGSSHGVKKVMIGPSNEQFSAAPAIEYNWNQSFGIIGGVWWTFAGRNISRYTAGVIALNIYK